MIDFIKTLFNIGDIIYLTYNDGVTVNGKIIAFGASFIAIESDGGNVIGVKEENIESFSKEPICVYNHANAKSSYKEKVSYSVGNESAVKLQRNDKNTFKQYQPGDKIPIELLAKRDATLANSWKKTEKERKDLQALKERIKATYEEVKSNATDLDQVVGAIGVIVELRPSFVFGFIDDAENGQRYYFNRSDIVDEELKNEIVGEGIQVYYQRTTNHKGGVAKCIHRPQTIGELIEMAMRYVEINDLMRAKMIFKNILTAYPSSTSAQLMLEQTHQKKVNSDTASDAETQVGKLYFQAKEAFKIKDYELALQLYQECIDDDIRKQACIKEMAQVYMSMHSKETDEEAKDACRQKAFEFIETHQDELPDGMSKKFFLENFYFSLGEYSKHIDVVEDIITESGNSGELGQYVFYLNKAAQSYLRLNDLDRALDATNQGLEVEPNNPHLNKTKEEIEQSMSQPAQEQEYQEVSTANTSKGKGLFGFLSR